MKHRSLEKKLKILFPIGTFYPAMVGGPSLSVYWLTRELKRYNVEPIIVTTSYGIKREHNIELNKFLETDYGRVIYIKEKNYKLPLNTIMLIKEILLKDSIDIVHLTSIFYPLSLATYSLFKKKSGIIWSPRGELLDKALDKGSKTVKRMYIKIIQKIISNETYFHSTSLEETKSIKKFFPNNLIFEIPNFIRLANRQNMPIKNQILYLGRLHPIKNIESLIRAIKLNEEIFKRYKIIIAGTGDANYTNFLRKEVSRLRVEDYVKFVGHIEGEKKDQLISESKCLVLPSHSENFGMVVVEALAQGTPVIASKYTPWKELVEYNAGFWIEPTPENITSVLKKIVTMTETDYEKMRKNALLLARKYDIRINIHKWLNAYSKVLAGT